MSAVLKMLAGAQAAATFGRANDQQAIALCRGLRDDLSESGRLHTSLPEVIANGNLLLQIESQQK